MADRPVYLRIPETTFDLLIRQLRKRAHRLRNELNNYAIKFQEQPIETRGDLAEVELLKETLVANAHYGEVYVEPSDSTIQADNTVSTTDNNDNNDNNANNAANSVTD